MTIVYVYLVLCIAAMLLLTAALLVRSWQRTRTLLTMAFVVAGVAFLTAAAYSLTGGVR